MKKFFRGAHTRDEDYSQIQYLTAKCTRLAHEKVLLERECLVSGERQRILQKDLEAMASRLLQQETINMEHRVTYDQLTSMLQQQQELVEFLQQQVRQQQVPVESSSREDHHTLVVVGHLEQVNAELQCLQSTEGQLESLVMELHAEAQHRAALSESLQAELHSKTMELEALQKISREQRAELKELHSSYQTKVRELQQENDVSLRKLQETAEQFEWLCVQQRYWICGVKRFKDSLTEERDALIQKVHTLEKQAEELMKTSQGDCSPAQRDAGPPCCDRRRSSWDADVSLSPSEGHEWRRALNKDLFNQGASSAAVDPFQKPP